MIETSVVSGKCRIGRSNVCSYDSIFGDITIPTTVPTHRGSNHIYKIKYYLKVNKPSVKCL